MYEIENGVPIPPPPGGAGRPTLYPLGDLEVGQSFFVPGKTTRQLSGSISIYRKSGRKFVTRTVDGGARVWRVAAMLLCAVAVGSLLLTTPAEAADFKAVEPHACAPSLESWLETHGRKTDGGPVSIGEPFKVTWDSGTLADVLLLPGSDPATSQPAVCVVMSRFLGRA